MREMKWYRKQSWLSYLPEPYQRKYGDDDFLERFLMVFQSFYEETDRKIMDMPDLADPALVPKELLAELGSWIGERQARLWEEKRYRQYLHRAVHLYAKRGTVQGIREFLYLFTGAKSYIREKPGELRIMLPDTCVPTQEGWKRLMNAVERMLPEHVKTEFVFLEKRIRLGDESYIGLNSVLHSYGPAILDERQSIPFILEGDHDEESYLFSV